MKLKSSLLIVFVLFMVVAVGTYDIQAEENFKNISKDFKSFKVEGIKGRKVENKIIFERGYIYLPFSSRDAVDEYNYEFESEEEEEESAAELEVNWVPYKGEVTSLEVEGLVYNLDKEEFDFSEVKAVNEFTNSFKINNLVTAYIDKVNYNNEGLTLDGYVNIESNLLGNLENHDLPINEFLLTKKGDLSCSIEIDSIKSVTLCETFNIMTDKIYVRNGEYIKSIYILDEKVKYTGAIGERISSKEGDINVIEIEETDEVIKFDVDMDQDEVTFAGLKAIIYPREITNGLINFTGTVFLPKELPGRLSGLPIKIYRLGVDTYNGKIVNFNGYPDKQNPVQIGGWKFNIYQVIFDAERIVIGTEFMVPEGILTDIYSHGLAGNYVEVNDFVLDYKGKIKEFNVEIHLGVEFTLKNGTKVKAGGMGIAVENGNLDDKLLLLKEAKLILSDGREIKADGLGINSAGQLVWPESLSKYESKYKNVKE